MIQLSCKTVFMRRSFENHTPLLLSSVTAYLFENERRFHASKEEIKSAVGRNADDLLRISAAEQ